MDYYLFAATVSLVIQLVILLLLLVGMGLKRKSSFRRHGIIMMLALLVHLAGIFAIMLPSFMVGFVPFFFVNPSNLIGILSVVNAVFGTVAAVLGVWILGEWRLRTSLAYCMPHKKVMRITFAMWLTALVLGIAMYFVLNWPLLWA
jgi:uncharacterized membrane protein YozB (DUF420 family)